MKKSVIVILGALIFASAGLGVVGLLTSLKKESEIDKPKEYEIKYKYYLDDVEVSEMPKNNRPAEITEDYEDIYSFKRYNCSNNVEGTWDNSKWEFTPKKTSDATCVIYFESNFLDVNIKTNNATINELEALKDRMVKRNESITYSITPTEGYKFDKVECTNNQIAEWNEETSELTVKEVNKNTTCEISFMIDEYTVNFAVNHGTLTETEKNAKYGEEVSTIITPADEYIFNKVTCTNNQTATFDTKTNKLTISKLTNKTLCTIDFIANTYKVTLKVENGSPAEESKNIKNGNNATFTISPTEGYVITNPTISCTNSQNGKLENNLFQIIGVTNNTVCTVTLKADPNASTDTGNETE